MEYKFNVGSKVRVASMDSEALPEFQALVGQTGTVLECGAAANHLTGEMPKGTKPDTPVYLVALDNPGDVSQIGLLEGELAPVKEWAEHIKPHHAANGDLVSYADKELPLVDNWIDDSSDTVLTIKTGGNGDMYLVDSSGAVFVDFDSADHNQVHAAVRWIATFIKSIEP